MADHTSATISALASLFGAVIGATSTHLVIAHKSHMEARSRLALILLKAGHALYQEAADPVTVFEPIRNDILAAAHDIHSGWLYPRFRRSVLQEAYNLLGCDPGTLSRHCYNYPSRDEAERKVENLLCRLKCPSMGGSPKVKEDYDKKHGKR